MCALAQAGLKRQEFPPAMLLVLMRSQCQDQGSWEMVSTLQLEPGRGRNSSYSINSPPSSSAALGCGEALVSAGWVSLQVSAPVWEGV